MAHARSGTRPKYTLTFMAPGGEEDGLLGAIHYAERRKKEGTLKNIKFILNIDGVTFGRYLLIYSKDEELRSLITTINKELNIKGTLDPHDPDGYWLDAIPFRESGARALSGSSRGYNLYLWHRPEDRAETVRLDFAEICFRIFNEYINRIQNL